MHDEPVVNVNVVLFRGPHVCSSGQVHKAPRRGFLPACVRLTRHFATLLHLPFATSFFGGG
jgi:hypothetical protein